MLVRGPFTIKWGDNTIEDIEEIDVEYDASSDDFETVGGKIFEIDGPVKATAVLTLLKTDLAALAVLLPQNFIPNGQVMSTGETVNNAQGAIDVAPAACGVSTVYNNLDIISCANPGQVFRIVNARTRLDGVEIDNKLQKVMVKFMGEPEGDEASVQFFKQGTIHVVS